MRLSPAAFFALALALALPAASAQQLPPDQQFAKDVYKELIEINSSTMTSGTTVAAEAMAKRVRDAGFSEKDIFLGGARAHQDNLVGRDHGRGCRLAYAQPLRPLGALTKRSVTVHAAAHSRSARSSVPRADNALHELAARTARYPRHSFAVHCNPLTRAFFEQRADIQTPKM